MKHFCGPDETVPKFYSDNAPVIKKAARDIGWRHDTSTPWRPTTNGVAEHAVRKVVECTRVILAEDGPPAALWPHAARHFCFASNTEVVEGGRHLLRLRHEHLIER